MTDLCFMCEKGQQMGSYSDAFGGTTGTICGYTYRLCHSRGHLLQLDRPENMVSDPKQKKLFATWKDLDAMPWPWEKLNWHKVLVRPYGKKYVDRIYNTANQCNGLVIATDNDPDKEGDLLGWEIVDKLRAMGWHGKVYRIRPQDLSKRSLIHAVQNMSDVTDQMKQGAYLEALARERFDFIAGIPLTRIPTTVARNNGYNIRVANEGRLKSVVLQLIFKQLQAIKNYHKTPYYEVRYKDDLGNVYKRKVEKGVNPSFRFKDKSDGENDLKNYQPESLANISEQTKRQQPPKMLSLDELSTQLSQIGCYPKQFANLYESMYMDSYVSYPRTADTGITKEQFKALLPKANQIADLVGVDKNLLTHRTLRKKHYTAHADHGANRPGSKVPSSLSGLASKFNSKYAPVIYKIVAKSFLSILCEDYIYKRISATPQNHDDFKGHFNIPVKYNFKEITGKPKQKKSVDLDKWKASHVKPFLYTGCNPKPTWPRQKWVVNYLKKNNVGTGATRTHVLTILVGHGKRVNKNVRILSNRGKFTLNRDGLISAIMSLHTYIGSVDVTNALHSIMSSVASFKHSVDDVCHMATVVVQHDKPIMESNVKLLSKYGIKKGRNKMKNVKKVTVNYNGSPIQIKDTWGGHKWTQDDLDSLSRGDKVSFKGKFGPVTGKLGKTSFKGDDGKKHTYTGFVPIRHRNPNRYYGTFKGKKFSLKKTWGKHHITSDEFKKLCKGTKMTFDEYDFPVKLGPRSFKPKGEKKTVNYIGIIPMWNNN